MIRTPERIDEILRIVGALWKEEPETRLGQLLVSVTVERGLSSIEDEMLCFEMGGYIAERRQEKAGREGK